MDEFPFEMPDIDPSDLQRWNPRYVAAMEALGIAIRLLEKVHKDGLLDDKSTLLFDLREEYDKLRDSEM